MIPELTKSAVPQWLENLNPTSEFPINDVLQGSVFYPACYLDGRPVKYLGGYSHSFVYVDCYIKREDLINNLRTFKGYKLLFNRPLQKTDLCFKYFSPMMPNASEGSARKPTEHSDLFAEWAIYERVDWIEESHGPKRFSLLYIGGEGAATFQALYYSNQCAPSAIVLIKSDGFTGNWTSFRDPYRILAQSVMRNPAGQPEYLFIDSMSEPCWPWYPIKVSTIVSILDYDGRTHQRIVLWGRSVRMRWRTIKS